MLNQMRCNMRQRETERGEEGWKGGGAINFYNSLRPSKGANAWRNIPVSFFKQNGPGLRLARLYDASTRVSEKCGGNRATGWRGTDHPAQQRTVHGPRIAFSSLRCWNSTGTIFKGSSSRLQSLSYAMLVLGDFPRIMVNTYLAF